MACPRGGTRLAEKAGTLLLGPGMQRSMWGLPVGAIRGRGLPRTAWEVAV